MIQVTDLTKKYENHTALDGLNLQVGTGSIYGLIGVNGSGKTTLIKQLTGVLKPDGGEILFNGDPVTDNAAVKEKIGYIPDELYFLPGYSLKAMGVFYRGLYAGWNQTRFEAMTEDFGLDPKARLLKFSKGMQKQAAFILAMSTMPHYLILDEPIDGLDPIMRKKLWGWILGDVADRQMTVLISSHNLRELEGICDAVGILNKGKIRFQGKLDELKDEMKDMSLEEIFLYEMEGGTNENNK